jgi:hypothetical protein
MSKVHVIECKDFDEGEMVFAYRDGSEQINRLIKVFADRHIAITAQQAAAIWCMVSMEVCASWLDQSHQTDAELYAVCAPFWYKEWS